MARYNRDVDEASRGHQEEQLRRQIGLCGSCVHMRVLVSDKGSAFAQCGKAKTDAAFAKYPHLPMLRCGGWISSDTMSGAES